MTEVRNRVMAKIASPDLRLYVVWVPVMDVDSGAIARAASGRLRDARASFFWDDAGALGAALGQALELPPRERDARTPFGFGWDLYLLYPAGVRWRDPAPVPGFWMHQLMGIAPSRAPMFDGDLLRRKVLLALDPGRAAAQPRTPPWSSLPERRERGVETGADKAP